jgi:hypothetical protein
MTKNMNEKNLKRMFSREYKTGYRQGHFAGFWDYSKDRSPPKHYRTLQRVVYIIGYESGCADGKKEWNTCGTRER